MVLPKFLIGDNTDYPEDIFIVHTEYPQFIINLKNDEIEWLDDIQGDESELANLVTELIDQASTFYDQEIKRYAE